MKVRVKGLVFVGFAAAIFAQNAMAAGEADARTVTSKLYVDQKIDQETTSGTTTIDEDSPNDKAPSSKNVYDFVTGQIATLASVANIQGDGTYINVHDVTVGEGNDAHTVKQVDAKEGVATTAAQLTGPISSGVAGAFTGNNGNKLVSATAVKALIDTEATDGTTTLGDSSTNEKVPTSKNVVDYAEKKANKLAYNNGETITAAATATSGNTSNTTYPTVKNVYEFVKSENAAYQPKVGDSANVDTNGKSKVMIGYTTRSGEANNYSYSSEWKQLAGDDYITVGLDNSDNPKVSLGNFAASTDLYGSTGTNDDKLVKAGAVRSVTLQASGDGTQGSPWATTITGSDQNDKFPSAKNVYEFVTGRELALGTGTGNPETISGNSTVDTKVPTVANVYKFVMAQLGNLPIPEPGEDCSLGTNGITDSNNHACALVLAYWTAAESPTNQAGVGLKWVPMPQP